MQNLVRKIEGKIPAGRPRRKWEWIIRKWVARMWNGYSLFRVGSGYGIL